MKKILLLLLCGILIFNAASCNRNDDPEETDGTEGITASKYTFISNEEKSTWRSNLTAILSKIEIHEFEPGIPGSFAIGLMDINFDNSPEVLAAHAGGSMGNIFIEIYDLDSGEQLISYNAARWESSENIYLCVADKNGEYVVLSEGALRNDIGWMKLITVLPKSIDSQSRYLMTENLFTESVSNEVVYYEHNGKIIEKSQYDEYYQTFLDEYKKIESTQIQLIKWSSIESENRNELVEKMADALINTSQDFIDNK